MIPISMIPQGATHLTYSDGFRIAGGQFRVYYTFYKLDLGTNSWKMYYSDTDNEYPQWIDAASAFRKDYFKPEKLIPINV